MSHSEKMTTMVQLSLLLNVLVLVPVCAGLLLNARWVQQAFGSRTPARGILLSMYLAIGLTSLGLLFRPQSDMALALLVVQILYKFMSPFTVGTLKNPVVVSNLAIATFHFITVTLAWD